MQPKNLIFLFSTVFLLSLNTLSASGKSQKELLLDKKLFFSYLEENLRTSRYDLSKPIDVEVEVDKIESQSSDLVEYGDFFRFVAYFYPLGIHKKADQKIKVYIKENAIQRAIMGEIAVNNFDVLKNASKDQDCYYEYRTSKNFPAATIIIAESKSPVFDCIHAGVLRAFGLLEPYWKYLNKNSIAYDEKDFMYLFSLEMLALDIIKDCKKQNQVKESILECAQRIIIHSE